MKAKPRPASANEAGSGTHCVMQTLEWKFIARYPGDGWAKDLEAEFRPCCHVRPEELSRRC